MGWYEALKDTVSFAEHLRNAELDMRLAGVRVECAKLAEENARLRDELTALREQTSLRAAMEFRENVYWRKGDGMERSEGPFCPKCLDGTGKAARMAVREESDYWRCLVCDCVIQRPGPSREDYGPGRAIIDDPCDR